jgi:hypothetical protein
MDKDKKYSFLFVVEMTGGNATYFQNLKDIMKVRSDTRLFWMTIQQQSSD